jgi:hypothetical protein
MLQVTMIHTKSTKGTFVYTTDNEDASITTLYIKKQAFKEPPKVITITIAPKGE